MAFDAEGRWPPVIFWILAPRLLMFLSHFAGFLEDVMRLRPEDCRYR